MFLPGVVVGGARERIERGEKEGGKRRKKRDGEKRRGKREIQNF